MKQDLWEKLSGSKRLLGGMATVLGIVLTCIPVTQIAGTVLLGSGLSALGLGVIHAAHKRNNFN